MLKAKHIDMRHVMPRERRIYFKLIAHAAWCNHHENYSDADLLLLEADHYKHRPKIVKKERKDETIS